MFVAAILCLVGLVSGQGSTHPQACCVDREFEAVLGEVGGSIVTEHGVPTQKLIQGYNILHYDFYSRKMAIELHRRQPDGTTKVTHILYDFMGPKTYITSLGKCKVVDIPPGTHFREPCLPHDAKYLGETYMGYGASKLPLQNWEFKAPFMANATMRAAITVNGCIPIVEAMYGYNPKDGNEFDKVYVFNNFHPGIRRRDVFDIPALCHQGHQHDIPETANRVVRKIINLYS